LGHRVGLDSYVLFKITVNVTLCVVVFFVIACTSEVRARNNVATERCWVCGKECWIYQNRNGDSWFRKFREIFWRWSAYPVALATAAIDAICTTTVPVGTRLHWSTVWVGWDGMASVVDGSAVWQGELK